jgi:hypothetical protein
MLRQSLLLFAVLCIGILGGYVMLRFYMPDMDDPHNGTSRDTVQSDRQHNNNVDENLARLRQQLAQAEQERQWLADRITKLEAEAGRTGMPANADAGISVKDTNNGKESITKDKSFRTSVETLIEAGIPAEQAAWIQSRLDEYDLKMLYMKDRATREGWIKTTRLGGQTGWWCVTSFRTRLLSNTACRQTTASLCMTASGYSPAKN